MSMPFYVSPDQVMKDRAEFARKGISRGRALVACKYDLGIVMLAENASSTLRKISEIYDRIAFAGVGKYNEFDSLRQAGVRAADLQGYQFSRADVDARTLANNYAQWMGNVFTHEQKPLEVEILIAEIGQDASEDRLFHLLYDGTVMDEENFTVLGGDAESIIERMKTSFTPLSDLSTSLKISAIALSGPDRSLAAGELEVAVLERNGHRRCFRRLSAKEISAVLVQ